MKFPLRKKWLVYSITGLFLALILAAGIVSFFPRQVLTMDSGEVTADAIVVLGGTPDRAYRAAELFRQGAAPKVIVTGFGDDQINVRILEENGVAATNIILESVARTTRENAVFSIPLLRNLGAKRVIIVTSWYHSRRGLHVFEHYAPDLTFYSRPSYYGFPQGKSAANWKDVRGYAKTEYLKLLGYWICYGVCPLG